MKAIISAGNKQHIVSEGDVLLVDLIAPSDKKLSFAPLLVITDKETLVGTPEVSGHTVTAEVVTPEVKADKVLAIRDKAKKRVHKVRGHRQKHTEIKIVSIK